MTRISDEELRRSTLARQFPRVPGRGRASVLELVERLGPIQSQVPRAPFLTVSSRLPGVPYEVVRDLFAAHELLKTSSLRGTVHTTTRADFVRTDAVARSAREPLLRRELKLSDGVTPEELIEELERFTADEWRPRAEIVQHVTTWLADRGVRFEPTTFSANLIWGHSGLVRRPKDSHWERRTDTFHRLASEVAELPPTDPAVALAELVRVHLRSSGPLTRADLSFFFGVGLGRVDAALRALGDEVVQLCGPGGQSMLDLAEPPPDGDADPGVRLLPEYDGLLVGYAGPNRTRFCGPEQLARVWAKANGVFSPVVLADGRLVATWKTVTAGRRTRLEVEPLPGESAPTEDALQPQVAALSSALALEVDDVATRR